MRACLKLAVLAAAVGLTISLAAPLRASAATAVSHGPLLYSEDFSGRSGAQPDQSLWTDVQGGGGWGNHELQTYTNRPSNVSLDGAGHLLMTARRETYTGADGITQPYTSSRLITKVGFQYGYLEARIRTPLGQGLWPAFWMVGSDVYTRGWPACGEIDVMESGNQMLGVLGSLHGLTSAGGHYSLSNGALVSGGLSSAWHTVGVRWTADRIDWYVDGLAYASVTRASMAAGQSWPFDKPFLVQLNLAVGGDTIGDPAPTTVFPATMAVDYVRLYAA